MYWYVNKHAAKFYLLNCCFSVHYAATLIANICFKLKIRDLVLLPRLRLFLNFEKNESFVLVKKG